MLGHKKVPAGTKLERSKQRFLASSPHTNYLRRSKNRIKAIATGVLVVALVCLFIFIIWSIIEHKTIFAIIGFFSIISVTSILISLRSTPDFVRSQAAQQMLWIASATLSEIKGGLTPKHAQAICERIMPETQAIAIALTNTTNVLAFVGRFDCDFPPNAKIRTEATKACLKTGEMQTFSFNYTPDIDVFHTSTKDSPNYLMQMVHCGIVVPLNVRDQTVGTLKFYYTNYQDINQSEYAIAAGFGELLSTQLALLDLDNQAKLRSKAEIKALQFQISPHFLFNMFNTVASLTRTNPQRARELLQDLSSFYRSTLENPGGFVPLDQELDRVHLFVKLEQARFGEENVCYSEQIAPEVLQYPVPTFVIQPLVENAISHGRKEDEPLHISIRARRVEHDLEINVVDDGKGLSQKELDKCLEQASLKWDNVVDNPSHSGIALLNIRQRVSAISSRSKLKVTSDENGGFRAKIVIADAF